MTHGAPTHTLTIAPRVNIAQARNCPECNGWGTVVRDGYDRLCSHCQETDSQGRLDGDD